MTTTTIPIPTDRKYTVVHSWVAAAADLGLGYQPLRVGITDVAVEGARVIAVELPPVRTLVEAGEPCALIWTSPLSAMPVYAPIDALVTEVNALVRDDPEIVSRDPYQAGWLFAVRPAQESSSDGLLTASDYAKLFGIADNPSKGNPWPDHE